MNKVVKDAAEAPVGSRVRVRVARGGFEAEVKPGAGE